ncbi:MAG: hypothetical protein RL660_859 [Bacteroidota bacterium]
MAAVLLLSCNCAVYSQNSIPHFISNSTSSLTDNFIVFDSIGYLIPKQGTSVSTSTIISVVKEMANFTAQDSLAIARVSNDADKNYVVKDPQLHTVYQQYYSGIPVEYGQIVVHSSGTTLRYVCCKIVEYFDKVSVPAVSASAAITTAIQAAGDSLAFDWLDTALEAELCELTGIGSSTYYPAPSLVFAKKTGNGVYDTADYELCWQIRLRASTIDFDATYYINAATNTLTKVTSNLCHDGPAQTLYYGSNTIDTKHRLIQNDNILHTDDNLRNIHTKVKGNGAAFNVWSNVADNDDNWQQSDATATTAHLVCQNAWDFFQSTFTWVGVQGNNSNKVQVVVDNTLINNAHYRNMSLGVDRITFGQSQVGNFLTTFDIAGHEFGHGVDEYSAQLPMSSITGALDESFADIYGLLAESFRFGGAITNWTLGEDANLISRSFSNPPLFSQPCFFQGPGWFNVVGCIPAGINDRCGVHVNSGVQNYFFYLLSNGSAGAVPGTIDNISVNGIGLADAGLIVFQNHTNFMPANAQYEDAQINSILAAQNIFGACSPEVVSTTNAWAAVGIGQAAELQLLNLPILQSWTLGSPVINLPVAIAAIGDNLNNANYVWTFSPNITAVAGGPNDNVLTITGITTLSSGTNPYAGSWVSVAGNCQNISTAVRVWPILSSDLNGGAELAGTGTVKNLKLTASPNPTTGYVEISHELVNNEQSGNTLWNYALLAYDGSIVIQGTNLENLPNYLDLSSYVAGEYVFVAAVAGLVATVKIIKR